VEDTSILELSIQISQNQRKSASTFYNPRRSASMTKKSELGKYGEDRACEYLVEKGYKIVERNFRKPWGELDIVAKAPDKTLTFVEVKTMKGIFSQGFFTIGNRSSQDGRSSSDVATRGVASNGIKPEDQMTRDKLRKFKKAASLYAGHRQDLIKDKKGWRLDLIAIVVDGDDHSIKHYENIS